MQDKNEYRIRAAKESDLQRIVEIYNASVPGGKATADTQPVAVSDRVQWFRDRDHAHRPIWVLESANEIAAWISLQSFYGRPAYSDTAEVSVYVDIRHHGKGFGTLLLKTMIESCPDIGVTTLLGFVFSHNESCLRMNKKLGFERWGLLPQVANVAGRKCDLVIDGLRVKS